MVNFILKVILCILATGVSSERERRRNHKRINDYSKPLPYTYVHADTVPNEFSWNDVNGTSFLTRALNQHIPQYCGSCWAHAAISALQDRIKIFKHVHTSIVGPDVYLSIQFILNCGADIAGSCRGGSATGAYELIKSMGFIPFESCQPYIACSKDSGEGFCPFTDPECSPMNICRTCTNPWKGGECASIDEFPNATIADYGMYLNPTVDMIKAEIFARGPVTTGIHGPGLKDYIGGIIRFSGDDDNLSLTHEVSIVGWGVDAMSDTEFWIVRNSHGEYWGEFSFFRIEMGFNVLGIETEISFATPGTFSIHNRACLADGTCFDRSSHVQYLDSSLSKTAYGLRILKSL